MNANETRIFPLSSSMSAEYAIVSMPATTWYWLDDMVSHYYPHGGYSDFIRRVPAENPDELTKALGDWAQEYCEGQMAELYSLANDNERIFPGSRKTSPSHPYIAAYKSRMPTVYQLFRFMPHATYLTTVWERRNYHLRGDFL